MNQNIPTGGLSDPGYLSPGYIDVLFVPARDGSRKQEHSERDLLVSEPSLPSTAQKKPPSTLCTTLSTTSGYSIDQYDPERWIPVGTRAKNTNDSRFDTKKRKRDDSNKNDELKDFHQKCWDSFQYYLDRCIPVKIDGVSSFRDVSLVPLKENNVESNSRSSDSNNINMQEMNQCNEGVLCHVASLPSTILDTMVTVQCAFTTETSTREKPGDSLQELDRAISFCTYDENFSCPTFMGQEDQVTSEMTLKEVISWKRSKSHDFGASNSDRSNDDIVVTMAVCVAQEPILTISSSSDRRGTYQYKSQIQIQLDGRVNKNEKHDESVTISAAVPPLAPLAAILRMPSFLLLGNPQEIDNNTNESSNIIIHDINLWHAPQNCCTNAHYDDRDNLLLVTEGVKTVEMCPPGCIEGSPIYSEHANHPALLRRTRAIALDCQSKQTILELKRGRTHIVSVAAGQALYIPPGWWHRVESESACTAVNVWFEYKDASQQDVPKHMVDFRHRQAKRKYYEQHETELATSYLEMLRREQQRSSNALDMYGSLSCFSCLKKENWISLKEMAFGDEFLDAESEAAFVNAFIQCWETCINTFSEKLGDKSSPHELRELTYIPCFAAILNAFLLRIRLDGPQERRVLVRMWAQFPLPQQKWPRATSFTNLIKHLEPSSCYVITDAWERHASAADNPDYNGMSNQAEVEKSYKHFFNMFDDDCIEKTIRLHLLDSVETWKKEMCNSLMH
ncbi:hypothetical protein ACHAW6_014471 [Cyclotella cf. meneghiniana]